ncbi:Ies1p KNAG_0G01110 [Huiozyma naganishii CBS 8797]|uniref:Ino eighty subunit 1 n=1 Tax=Huiozyma naganishii (strain ATCC MYA-139 / BCRC 22969 / CBS 8797 / KCTC 17520 / NBRC 10181 / NCYC 3082 / Yp74L-3) TaxID=1071383 RepID=J7S7T5_HUIN7|nr:hypothetical protein KNAG_0G01110 [Kazachstania naganishii CBS 8797]CCK71169.1 hypothetical protein KNAG_0G01110 [Kazachstania naganishii CBS 8797]
MGRRVYDPIHDVFQEPVSSGSVNGGGAAGVVPMVGSQTVVQVQQPLSKPMTSSIILNSDFDEDGDTGGESTQSEDNTSMVTVRRVDPQRKRGPPPGHPPPSKRRQARETSKYNRHLKKPDGSFFSRRDVQYTFLRSLMDDKRALFTNIFKNHYSFLMVPGRSEEDPAVVNVTDWQFNARKFFMNEKLTFSQLYVLCLATSGKCSKVLREKLLTDPQVSFSTCLLAFLVNIGRLNTTINFYLEMTSQLRTFHSVPCLQLHNVDPKSLQDTPRLKSILKNLPLGNEPVVETGLRESVSESQVDHYNVVNMIFHICDNVTQVNQNLLTQGNIVTDASDFSCVNLFQVLDTETFTPETRRDVVLWLLYLHLETGLDKVSESFAPFGKGQQIELLVNRDPRVDEDPVDEYEFGLDQEVKRREFLKRINGKTQAQTPEPVPVPVEDVDVDDDEIKGEDDTVQEDTEEAVTMGPSAEDMHTRQVNRMIELDKNKPLELGDDDDGNNSTTVPQCKVVTDLLASHEYVRLHRRELGLVKVFNDYEDIPMASVIGIRGKKRKKYRDGLLGFETDYLRVFKHCKRVLLEEAQSGIGSDSGSGVFRL